MSKNVIFFLRAQIKGSILVSKLTGFTPVIQQDTDLTLDSKGEDEIRESGCDARSC